MWKDCQGCPGWQVSESGQVRRLIVSHYDKMKKYAIDGYYYPDSFPVDSEGYLHFGGNWYSLHRAVAETFIPNPNNLPCVNHIDGVKANNLDTNLEWCTYKENSMHAVRIGLIKTGKESPMYGKCGSLHPCSASNKGNQWNLGRETTEDTKTKISARLKGNKNGCGHKVSEEVRKIMSDKAKIREQNKRKRGV